MHIREKILCCTKSFVRTKHVFCHNKSTLATTKLLSQQIYVCRGKYWSWQKFCCDKHMSQQAYFCCTAGTMRETHLSRQFPRGPFHQSWWPGQQQHADACSSRRWWWCQRRPECPLPSGPRSRRCCQHTSHAHQHIWQPADAHSKSFKEWTCDAKSVALCL